MKLLLTFIIVFLISLTVITSFLINIFPPTIKELIGTYESVYDDKHYYLDLKKSKNAKILVLKDKDIFYKDTCKKYSIENIEYKRVMEYRIDFSNCEGMDFSALLERKLNLDIVIGNNGTEFERIDPDENIFYSKITHVHKTK